MAREFDDSSSALAGALRSTSQRQRDARRILLGHGESGQFASVQHSRTFNWLSAFSCPCKVFGTVELPEKPIMLPPFVDSTHCLPYHLTKKGRSVADRVVSVLGYACPDITYSPSLYPITAILLHFMTGKLSRIEFSCASSLSQPSGTIVMRHQSPNNK